MKRNLLFALMLILSLVLFSSCNKTAGVVNDNSPVKVEEQSSLQEGRFKSKAIDFELKSFNGDEIKLSKLKGKVVVINFFTTWCKYCILEMPGFIHAMNKLSSNKSVKFLFIDVSESKKDVASFLRENHYEKLNPLMDESGKVFAAYGSSGFPSTFIIDKSGNVSFHQDGQMEETFLMEKINAVLK